MHTALLAAPAHSIVPSTELTAQPLYSLAHMQVKAQAASSLEAEKQHIWQEANAANALQSQVCYLQRALKGRGVIRTVLVCTHCLFLSLLAATQ